MKGNNLKSIKIDYTRSSSKSFEEAVRSVEAETAKVGFRVLYIHDVQQTLNEKGFKIEPLKIIEICNAKNAYNVIQKDIRLALCLPCKINVYVKNGKTYISGMRPVLMEKIFPKLDVRNIISEVDTVIKEIINNAK